MNVRIDTSAADLQSPHAFALAWLWGGMLYIWMMSLILYRYTFFPISPGDLSPP